MSAINMHQIEVFLCAAKHQNISRAAEELYISQPALSKTISRIEKDYGGALFHRVVKRGEGERLLFALVIDQRRVLRRALLPEAEHVGKVIKSQTAGPFYRWCF